MHIASRFLFQAVQSQPAYLILNSYVEFLCFIGVLKDSEPATSSRLRDGYLMKFFAFDRNPA